MLGLLPIRYDTASGSRVLSTTQTSGTKRRRKSGYDTASGSRVLSTGKELLSGNQTSGSVTIPQAVVGYCRHSRVSPRTSGKRLVTIPQAVVGYCRRSIHNTCIYVQHCYDTASGSRVLSTVMLRSRMVPGL